MSIPRTASPDSTIAFLTEGYDFVGTRCRRLDTDVFETRLMGRRVVCMSGAEAASVFYHPGRLTRRKALPPTTLRLLQGKGSVQGLDGEAHHHRKRLFMSFMTPESIAALTAAMEKVWDDRLLRWSRMETVELHHEVEEILCRAVCTWAGVPLSEDEASERTKEFSAMIDGAGAVGPRAVRGLYLRSHTERWAHDVIDRVRGGQLPVPDGSPVQRTAWQAEPNGRLLPTRVAVVELLNFLRPTVAVARFVTYAALALHEHGELREQVRQGDAGYARRFAQEVRRYYPFFPVVAGRVLHEFEWRDRHFTPGDWIMLDIYGTNRDRRTWRDADSFWPDRFKDWDEGLFSLIPQGGGDADLGHRCPADEISISLTAKAVQKLASMSYAVPAQDLSIDLSRIPAIPASRFVMTGAKQAAG
jgi:fatty-acid peroxygenase